MRSVAMRGSRLTGLRRSSAPWALPSRGPPGGLGRGFFVCLCCLEPAALRKGPRGCRGSCR